MTLFDKLTELKNSDIYPLHMPGHKRNPNSGGLADIYGIDITEIDGFDDLHQPEGIIKELSDKAASLYGANKAWLSVNGSSASNIAAIMSVCNRGEKLIIPRNAHKSVYYGIELSGAEPVYIIPEMIEGGMVYAPVTPGQVEESLRRNPGCKAVLVTSPTYEGVAADISQIAETVHRHGGILIVDSAHGAHFGFSDLLPVSAAEAGADLVILSLHKMLPSPTQTGLLLRCSERVEEDRISHYMQVFQSSSPSYILMAGIGEAIEYISLYGEKAIEQGVKRLEVLRYELSGLSNIDTGLPKDEGFEYDPFKLLIRVRGKKLCGREIYDKLRLEHHIQCEMCGSDYALGLFTVMDTEEGYNRIAAALKALDSELGEAEGKYESTFEALPPLPKSFMGISDAVKSPGISVDENSSEGCISAAYITVYPPGSPVLVPGELIDKRVLAFINEGSRTGLNIQGTIDGKISVVRQ